jgi:hypothetical protein
MQNQTALDYLSNKVEEQREIVVNSILTGNISDYEYRRLVGVLQGLDFSSQLFNDLAKKMENDDE